MEIIRDKQEQIIAILIRQDYSPKGTEFYTPAEFSQQLGIIKYGAGHMIKPHYHNYNQRSVTLTQEVLYIKKGKVKVFLYDNKLEHLQDIELNQGDVILLASGGHGFEMMEDSEMVEVKQGPYDGVETDKTHFDK